MAINPQKREEMRYTGGITDAPTVNPDFANGSAAPILSGQTLAEAMLGRGSAVTTFDYSQKPSAPAKKAPAKTVAKPTPKPNVSRDAAKAKAATAAKVSSRPSGESYSAPKKATVTSRADSASSSKVSLKMPGIGPMASIAPKASASAASKPKASVNNMYKATYGTSLPKIKPPATPEQKAAKKASISKMYTATYGRPLQPKAKPKKPLSASVNKMYEETYGKKLK